MLPQTGAVSYTARSCLPFVQTRRDSDFTISDNSSEIGLHFDMKPFGVRFFSDLGEMVGLFLGHEFAYVNDYVKLGPSDNAVLYVLDTHVDDSVVRCYPQPGSWALAAARV